MIEPIKYVITDSKGRLEATELVAKVNELIDVANHQEMLRKFPPFGFPPTSESPIADLLSSNFPPQMQSGVLEAKEQPPTVVNHYHIYIGGSDDER